MLNFLLFRLLFATPLLLVGAFINKRAPDYYSHSFFSFFKDRLEATNVNVQDLQLKETKRIPRKRI